MRELEHESGHCWFRTSVVDEEAIDHERQIAVVQATGELVRVRVAQRVDFDLLADPILARVSTFSSAAAVEQDSGSVKGRCIGIALWIPACRSGFGYEGGEHRWT
jgi:hypothetical protein